MNNINNFVSTCTCITLHPVFISIVIIMETFTQVHIKTAASLQPQGAEGPSNKP